LLKDINRVLKGKVSNFVFVDINDELRKQQKRH